MKEKEIIGYKLVKPEYEEAASVLMGHTGFAKDDKRIDIRLKHTIDIFKKAGVLDLWFEPVYKVEEPKFKVGDWITIEDSNKLQSGCRGCPKGTYQVVDCGYTNGLSDMCDRFNIKVKDEVWKVSEQGVRPATEEEINRYNYKVGDWVTVLDTPDVRKWYEGVKAIGHTFQIRETDEEFYYNRFVSGKASAIDPDNEYSINYKVSDVRKATQEEIDLVRKKKIQELEIGGWYTCDDVPTSIICHQGNNKGYGIWEGKWNSDSKTWLIGVGGSWRKLSNEEIKKRLTEYAREHYPVGTVFKCVHMPDYTCKVTNNNFSVNFRGSARVRGFSVTSLDDDGRHYGCIPHCFDRVVFKDGKWAEKVIKTVLTKDAEEAFTEALMEVMKEWQSKETEKRRLIKKESESKEFDVIKHFIGIIHEFHDKAEDGPMKKDLEVLLWLLK